MNALGFQAQALALPPDFADPHPRSGHAFNERQSMGASPVGGKLEKFERLAAAAWQEIIMKGARDTLEGLNLNADKEWGLNFFKGALYEPSDRKEPRVIFEFSFLPTMSTGMAPEIGALYFDVSRYAFKLVWRAVDFAGPVSPKIFVQNMDVMTIAHRLSERGIEGFVGAWSEGFLNPNAYYHSRPLAALQSVLDHKALLSVYETAYRNALLQVAA